MLRYALMSLGAVSVTALLLLAGAPAQAAGPVGIAVALLSFLTVETRLPRLDRTVVKRDVAHALLSAATAQLCLVAATLVLDGLGRQQVQWGLFAQVVAVVLGTDFLGYWAHRAQHRFGALWAPHAIHHMPRALYWLNGLRAHPGDTAFAFAVASLWTLVAGFSTEAFVLGGVVSAAHLLLQHTRVEFPAKLERVFVTPAWHRVHHDLQNRTPSNLGHILTIWDRVFGTFQSSSPGPVDLGITDRVHDSLASELLFPIRKPVNAGEHRAWRTSQL